MLVNDRQKDLVSYFNSLKQESDVRRKKEHAQAIEEMLLHRSPQMLPQYIDDVLHLASEPSFEVKAWVVNFIDKLLDTPHMRASPLSMFTKLGQTLLYLLSTDRAGYLGKAVAVAGAYSQKIQPFLIKFGRDPTLESLTGWQKLWSVTAHQIRNKVQRQVRQNADAERVKPRCYTFLKDMTLLYSPRPTDDSYLERLTADGTVDRAVPRVAGLDETLIQNNLILKKQELDTLAEQLAKQLIDCLYDQAITPALAVNAIHNIQQVCQQRPNLWKLLIPRFVKGIEALWEGSGVLGRDPPAPRAPQPTPNLWQQGTASLGAGGARETCFTFGARVRKMVPAEVFADAVYHSRDA